MLYSKDQQNQIDFHQPIAIIGMGCVFPGANSYEQFWQNNLNKKGFIKPIDRPETGIPEVYDPSGARPNTTSTRLGGVIEPFEFPYARFKGIMPNSISKGDYYQQYTLLAAQDAIDEAGVKAFFGQKDKTFVAVGHYIN